MTLYTGYRLSELLAIGRTRETIVCEPCRAQRSYTVADLITRLGDEVLPTVLTRMTPRCPMRRDNGRCMAVYVEPLTVEDEDRIKAMRRSGESPYPVLG